MPWPNNYDLAARIDAARVYATDTSNALWETYKEPTVPGFTRDDPRISTARSINGVLTAAGFSAMFLHEQLNNPAWWASRRWALDEKSMRRDENYYWSGVVSTFLLDPPREFEIGVRRLLRAIEPTALDQGNAPFKRIYDHADGLLPRLRAGRRTTLPQ